MIKRFLMRKSLPELPRGEEFIGGLSKAGLLVKRELVEEGDGVGAHTASVLDGEGVVVGREEDLGLKHGGVVLSFLVFGFTNGGAGADVGEVGSGRGSCDDGDVPVESGVGADEAVGDDPGAVAASRAVAEACFDLGGVAGGAAGAVHVLGDGCKGVVDCFVGNAGSTSYHAGEWVQ